MYLAAKICLGLVTMTTPDSFSWALPRKLGSDHHTEGHTGRGKGKENPVGPNLNSCRLHNKVVRDPFFNTSFPYFYLKGSYFSKVQ